ncbi:unnamed protein product [Amoebophrya sp. A120]|nr:unnamed protein product [Amoebophrya sp. A120]|eukprot:GSA120T00008001001.1
MTDPTPANASLAADSLLAEDGPNEQDTADRERELQSSVDLESSANSARDDRKDTDNARQTAVLGKQFVVSVPQELRDLQKPFAKAKQAAAARASKNRTSTLLKNKQPAALPKSMTKGPADKISSAILTNSLRAEEPEEDEKERLTRISEERQRLLAFKKLRELIEPEGKHEIAQTDHFGTIYQGRKRLQQCDSMKTMRPQPGHKISDRRDYTHEGLGRKTVCWKTEVDPGMYKPLESVGAHPTYDGMVKEIAQIVAKSKQEEIKEWKRRTLPPSAREWDLSVRGGKDLIDWKGPRVQTVGVSEMDRPAILRGWLPVEKLDFFLSEDKENQDKYKSRKVQLEERSQAALEAARYREKRERWLLETLRKTNAYRGEDELKPEQTYMPLETEFENDPDLLPVVKYLKLVSDSYKREQAGEDTAKHIVNLSDIREFEDYNDSKLGLNDIQNEQDRKLWELIQKTKNLPNMVNAKNLFNELSKTHPGGTVLAVLAEETKRMKVKEAHTLLAEGKDGQDGHELLLNPLRKDFSRKNPLQVAEMAENEEREALSLSREALIERALKKDVMQLLLNMEDEETAEQQREKEEEELAGKKLETKYDKQTKKYKLDVVDSRHVASTFEKRKDRPEPPKKVSAVKVLLGQESRSRSRSPVVTLMPGERVKRKLEAYDSWNTAPPGTGPSSAADLNKGRNEDDELQKVSSFLKTSPYSKPLDEENMESNVSAKLTDDMRALFKKRAIDYNAGAGKLQEASWSVEDADLFQQSMEDLQASVFDTASTAAGRTKLKKDSKGIDSGAASSTGAAGTKEKRKQKGTSSSPLLQLPVYDIDQEILQVMENELDNANYMVEKAFGSSRQNSKTAAQRSKNAANTSGSRVGQDLLWNHMLSQSSHRALHPLKPPALEMQWPALDEELRWLIAGTDKIGDSVGEYFSYLGANSEVMVGSNLLEEKGEPGTIKNNPNNFNYDTVLAMGSTSSSGNNKSKFRSLEGDHSAQAPSILEQARQAAFTAQEKMAARNEKKGTSAASRTQQPGSFTSIRSSAAEREEQRGTVGDEDEFIGGTINEGADEMVPDKNDEAVVDQAGEQIMRESRQSQNDTLDEFSAASVNVKPLDDEEIVEEGKNEGVVAAPDVGRTSPSPRGAALVEGTSATTPPRTTTYPQDLTEEELKQKLQEDIEKRRKQRERQKRRQKKKLAGEQVSGTSDISSDNESGREEDEKKLSPEELRAKRRKKIEEQKAAAKIKAEEDQKNLREKLLRAKKLWGPKVKLAQQAAAFSDLLKKERLSAQSVGSSARSEGSAMMKPKVAGGTVSFGAKALSEKSRSLMQSVIKSQSEKQRAPPVNFAKAGNTAVGDAAVGGINMASAAQPKQKMQFGSSRITKHIALAKMSNPHTPHLDSSDGEGPGS